MIQRRRYTHVSATNCVGNCYVNFISLMFRIPVILFLCRALNLKTRLAMLYGVVGVCVHARGSLFVSVYKCGGVQRVYLSVFRRIHSCMGEVT